MRIFLKVILILFICKLSFSQSSWIKQESNVSSNLYSIEKIDRNTLVVVGNDKTIIRTSNAGDNWNIIQVDNSIRDGFRHVFFVKNCGYIAYGGYMLLKTIDGGSNWNIIDGYKKSVVYQKYSYDNTYRQDGSILSLFFIDENTGFISTANTIPTQDKLYGAYRTVDGGNTWKPISEENSILTSIYFVDYYVGFSGYHDIYRTENGGNTWYKVKETEGEVSSFYFLNSNIGFCLCRSRSGNRTYILRTTDGGNSWQENYPSPYTNYFEYTLKSIKAVSEKSIFTVGSNGVILKSSDLGVTWNIQNSNVQIDLHDICFTDNKTGYIVGENGTILKSISLGD